jgi:hypothetical protein
MLRRCVAVSDQVGQADFFVKPVQELTIKMGAISNSKSFSD